MRLLIAIVLCCCAMGADKRPVGVTELFGLMNDGWLGACKMAAGMKGDNPAGSAFCDKIHAVYEKGMHLK